MAEATGEAVSASYFDPETLGKFLAEDVEGGTPEQRAGLFRALARIPTASVCGLLRRMSFVIARPTTGYPRDRLSRKGKLPTRSKSATN